MRSSARRRILIAGLLVAGLAQAELPSSISRGASSFEYGANYEPAEAKSLDAISWQVKQRLVRHLQRRLGEAFYRELSFAGGDIVDRAKLDAADPAARDSQREIPAYRLHFAFRMPEAGIERYVATIELRADGSILGDITLPCFSCHPEKLKFLPLPDVNAIAIAHGMSAAAASVRLDYSAEVDSLVWVYNQRVSEGGVANYDELVIDAHSGAIVGRSVSEAIGH